MNLRCPFVYATGKPCSGRIVRIEVYKADITWEQVSDSEWEFSCQPRSHYHLFCSEKENHAGYKREDDDHMKGHWDQLPENIRDLLLKGARFPV